jgi:hypothetical protein
MSCGTGLLPVKMGCYTASLTFSTCSFISSVSHTCSFCVYSLICQGEGLLPLELQAKYISFLYALPSIGYSFVATQNTLR